MVLSEVMIYSLYCVASDYVSDSKGTIPFFILLM